MCVSSAGVWPLHQQQRCHQDGPVVQQVARAAGQILRLSAEEEVSQDQGCTAGPSPTLCCCKRFPFLVFSSKNPEEAELEDTLNQVVRQCCSSGWMMPSPALNSPLNSIAGSFADGCVQVHRGQRRLSEVLCEDVG